MELIVPLFHLEVKIILLFLTFVFWLKTDEQTIIKIIAELLFFSQSFYG